MDVKARMWNRMYRGTPTWELGHADPTLLRVLDDRGIAGPGRALDVGCGTGDNAIALARRGFEVSAIDVAERALARAREKADRAGLAVEFRLADVTRLDDGEGSFDLIMDRGLLMSLFGEAARRSYASALIRLTADGGSVYEYQWELPQDPRGLSPGWLATKLRGFVVAPGEIQRRFGGRFLVETLHRSIEPTDDPGIRRMGIRRVAKTSYWLQRRPTDTAG